MIVERFINSIFSSNTYILNLEEENGLWVVDPGDVKPIKEYIKIHNKFLKGILITHSHFDHIYGVNELIEDFHTTQIFASKNARDGMNSAKLNGSYYTENPFVVKSKNINIVEENDSILLFNGYTANVIYTPGHNNDCLSFKINQHLFTGDALIPGIKVYTKSKFGDKLQAQKSIDRIIKECNPKTFIYPGHGDICSIEDFIHSGLYDFESYKEKNTNFINT